MVLLGEKSFVYTHTYELCAVVFGFIQICIYIMVNKMVEAYRNICVRTEEEIGH